MFCSVRLESIHNFRPYLRVTLQSQVSSCFSLAMLLEIFVKTEKQSFQSTFIYKYHNIQETAFWQFFFSNFSAFHSATVQHFTNTIERGLNLRRNSTSTRAHVLFSVYYVCYNCSTSVINASIDIRCFTLKMREKYTESTD